MKLKDRVAIVTGAAKGIGLGVAEALVEQGAKVLIADVDGAGEAVAEEIRARGGDAVFVSCDVTKEDDIVAVVDNAMAAWGRVDILVNNAGVGVYKTALEASAADFDLAINTNLRSGFLFSKYCIPIMDMQGKGVIINISSVHSFGAANGVLPYAASKGGVFAMTRNLAIDHGPVVRVNSVAPGWILTPLVEGILAGYENPAEQRRIVEDRQVMKRLGTPRDIGLAVAFLASDDASFITGTQLYVDGGMTAQLETL